MLDMVKCMLIKSKQYVREYQLSFNIRIFVTRTDAHGGRFKKKTRVILIKQYDCMIVNNKVDL